ncbi:hypothetical protein VTL71DRAFT_1429 [Oculimacula yallundae]|uniref:Uncharacterized protein n=1 Tax=Oculimacula yallundae TaxID=86028 RepID=A0ABR4CAP2_9HELO
MALAESSKQYRASVPNSISISISGRATNEIFAQNIYFSFDTATRKAVSLQLRFVHLRIATPEQSFDTKESCATEATQENSLSSLLSGIDIAERQMEDEVIEGDDLKARDASQGLKLGTPDFPTVSASVKSTSPLDPEDTQNPIQQHEEHRNIEDDLFKMDAAFQQETEQLKKVAELREEFEKMRMAFVKTLGTMDEVAEEAADAKASLTLAMENHPSHPSPELELRRLKAVSILEKSGKPFNEYAMARDDIIRLMDMMSSLGQAI